jgi:hypothetical protein
MPPTLEEKIAKTEAALRKDPDPARYATLAQRLATLNAAKKEVDDEDDEEDDEDDEKKSKKASAKKSEEKKSEEEEEEKAKRADEKKSAKKSEEKKSKKSDEDEEEEEEKAAKAALSLIEERTGRKGKAALGAAAAIFGRLDQIEADTATLKAKVEKDERTQLLESIVRHGAHKGMTTWLAKQDTETLRGFVSEALKQPKAVHTEEGDLLIPNAAKPNTLESLPKEVQEMVRGAVSALPAGMTAEAKQAFEADLVRKHHENMSKSLNGEGARY